MGKYLAYFTTNIKNALVYRGPLYVWLFSDLLGVMAMLAVWFSVESTGEIGGYTKNELISYYLLTTLLNRFVNWLPFYWIKDEIADGTIVGSTLTKPVSLLLKYLPVRRDGTLFQALWGSLRSA